jgi:glycosyltransferase involved in cell wall biosynthesis
MLSILIPIYNYDVFGLVKTLHNQCMESKIRFEIICLDDASNLFTTENQRINQLSNVLFQVLERNNGRSTIRNILAQKANFENLLFLDADTIPIYDNFIINYISQINKGYKIVYGGILYQSNKPSKEQLLRWVYGKKREALSIDVRNQNPYISFFTLNFLISKNIFSKVTFNENIPNLRHEDTLFSYEVMQNQINIIHIENPVYHLGIESSETFLKKSEEAVIGLKNLVDSDLISKDYVKLADYFFILKKYHLQCIVSFLFKITKTLFLKQLLSKKPSLLLFDLYRLSFYCSLS